MSSHILPLGGDSLQNYAPADAHPRSDYDFRPYIHAAHRQLTDTLLSYRDLLPESLIWMGKFALSGRRKLFSMPGLDQGAGATLLKAADAPWPLDVLLSCEAALKPSARERWRDALPAAVAVEIAMSAADLLDELTDDDPSPFVEKYGRGQALNTGNLMLVMAQEVLQRHALNTGSRQPLLALAALQEMLAQAALGQHLDMLYEGMALDEVTLDMSVRMTELKAGALVSGACRIGALMAGADDRIVDLLARFGKANGAIAQLANDAQDVTPRVSGDEPDILPERKTDLRMRKRTLPIVFALRDDSPQPNALQRAFSGDPTQPMDEEELRRAIVDAGGLQFVNLIIEVHRQNALEVLAELESLRPGAQAILRPLLPGF